MCATSDSIVFHYGRVVSVRHNIATVEISLSGGDSCGTCALAASCRRPEPSDSKTLQVEAVIPEGEPSPAVGSTVKVRPAKGSTGLAATLLFAMPVVIFLIVCGIMLHYGIEEGLSAVSALAAAALSLLFVHIFRRKLPQWSVVHSS